MVAGASASLTSRGEREAQVSRHPPSVATKQSGGHRAARAGAGFSSACPNHATRSSIPSTGSTRTSPATPGGTDRKRRTSESCSSSKADCGHSRSHSLLMRPASARTARPRSSLVEVAGPDDVPGRGLAARHPTISTADAALVRPPRPGRGARRPPARRTRDSVAVRVPRRALGSRLSWPPGRRSAQALVAAPRLSTLASTRIATPRLRCS